MAHRLRTALDTVRRAMTLCAGCVELPITTTDQQRTTTERLPLTQRAQDWALILS